MRFIFLIVLVLSLSLNKYAENTNYPLEHVKLDPYNQASLQRGAKYFMNYCSGCHSLGYLRYNQMAKDIGVTDTNGEVLLGLVKDNLMFNTTKLTDNIQTSMTTEDQKKWFGVLPPDLTLVTRYRSPSWVYSYLKSFYNDPKKQWGVNNLIFKDVAMPHVLANLQGEQELVLTEVFGSSKADLKLIKAGTLSPEQYDQVIIDLVNFLNYAAEPMKGTRNTIGIFVMIFLSLLLIFTYMLKREYWKDIH